MMEINSNGDKYWSANDMLHRDDGLPAIERANGHKEWWVNGQLHRDGGLPAIERVNNDNGVGQKEWWVNGQLHRDGGLPAIEWPDGDRDWYVNGKLHRDGGLPAIEWEDSHKAWYVDGKRHRDGGLPAVERANGDNEWWLNGIRYYPERWTLKHMSLNMVGQMCIISLETIQNDSEVCKCDVCHSLSLFGAMDEWIHVNETCPNCRSHWNSWIKYVN